MLRLDCGQPLRDQVQRGIPTQRAEAIQFKRSSPGAAGLNIRVVVTDQRGGQAAGMVDKIHAKSPFDAQPAIVRRGVLRRADPKDLLRGVDVQIDLAAHAAVRAGGASHMLSNHLVTSHCRRQAGFSALPGALKRHFPGGGRLAARDESAGESHPTTALAPAAIPACL